MNTTIEQAVAELNTVVFGKEDTYSSAEAISRCALYYMQDPQTKKLIAYALLRPGRITTLERYGVHPKSQGTGISSELLRQVCEKYPIIWTYVATINVASAAALTRAGFYITGGGGDWVNLTYVRSSTYPTRKVRKALPAVIERKPDEPEDK